IKYLYDTKTSFPEQKSYTWGMSSPMYRQDPLLETNVQALADQLFGQKGLTKVSEKSDLMMSMSYEFDSSLYQYSYQLRTLTLNVYKTRRDMPSPSDKSGMSMHKESTEDRELVWRGTAFGCINTDAASGDLKHAVEGILSHFPPH
ncbi:MAG TPA: DUF4136 domain-containing protein, partial [Thermodesulfovibrionales bacterium]|nr:DUF4136 domain-containing protein [Thermodesulfovibrionales bacterium]